jgi:hypothetical protein
LFLRRRLRATDFLFSWPWSTVQDNTTVGKSFLSPPFFFRPHLPATLCPIDNVRDSR